MTAAGAKSKRRSSSNLRPHSGCSSSITAAVPTTTSTARRCGLRRYSRGRVLCPDCARYEPFLCMEPSRALGRAAVELALSLRYPGRSRNPPLWFLSAGPQGSCLFWLERAAASSPRRTLRVTSTARTPRRRQRCTRLKVGTSGAPKPAALVAKSRKRRGRRAELALPHGQSGLLARPRPD